MKYLPSPITLLIAVLLVIATAGADEPENIKSESEPGIRWVTTTTFAMNTMEDLDDLVKIAVQGDDDAYAKKGYESGILMCKGDKVYLQMARVFRGKAQIRLPGETEKYWIPLDFLSTEPVKTLQEEFFEEAREDLLASQPDPKIPTIQQKPMEGDLAVIRLFLNQPLSAWEKVFGPGKVVGRNVADFEVGRFKIKSFFDGPSHVATGVYVFAKDGKTLTLKEASRIMASFGLTSSKKENHEITWGNKTMEGSFYDVGEGPMAQRMTLSIRTNLHPNFN